MKMNILNLIAAFLLVSFDLTAQSTWGPDQTDYRRDLWRYQSNDVQSNGLGSLNTVYIIGRESGPTIRRAVYQWNLPNEQIPDNSSIDLVRLVFSYDPFSSGDFPAKFYNIDYDMISDDYLNEIFDEMNYTVQDIGYAIGENNEVIYESSDPNAALNQSIRNMLPDDKFELGIKWSNDSSPYNNEWGIYNEDLLLYIEFTPPTKLVTIDQ